MGLAPSKKVAVPVGTPGGAPTGETVAVNVTGNPFPDGFWDEIRFVVVPCWMASVYACEPVAPTESVAIIVNIKDPVAVGVPFRTPVPVLKFIPGGSVPLGAEKVLLTVPLLAVIVTG